jgi:alanyl-tRNA synthetase
LSDEDIDKIETLANEIVNQDLPIEITIENRADAEKRYGFRIYQGGAIPEKRIRIVKIGEEIEACSGTHNMLKSTKEIGNIIIIGAKRIADGIVRLEFCSGEIALNYLREKEKILKEVAEKLGVNENEVVSACKKLFEEWKKERKRLKK